MPCPRPPACFGGDCLNAPAQKLAGLNPSLRCMLKQVQSGVLSPPASAAAGRADSQQQGQQLGHAPSRQSGCERVPPPASASALSSLSSSASGSAVDSTALQGTTWHTLPLPAGYTKPARLLMPYTSAIIRAGKTDLTEHIRPATACGRCDRKLYLESKHAQALTSNYICLVQDKAEISNRVSEPLDYSITWRQAMHCFNVQMKQLQESFL